jgi:exodeoxyribonuclease VII large subunit
MRLTAGLGNKLSYLNLQVRSQRKQLQALGPTEQLHSAQQQVSSLHNRLAYTMQQQLGSHDKRLKSISRMLHSVSPLPTINRGFGLVENDVGQVVTSVADLAAGDLVTTYLQDGSFVAEVKSSHAGIDITARRKK